VIFLLLNFVGHGGRFLGKKKSVLEKVYVVVDSKSDPEKKTCFEILD